MPKIRESGSQPLSIELLPGCLSPYDTTHVSIALLLSTAKLSIHPVRFLPWLLAVYAEGETGSVSPVRGMCPLSAISDLSLFLLVVNSLSPCKVSYKDPADAAFEFSCILYAFLFLSHSCLPGFRSYIPPPKPQLPSNYPSDL